MKQRFIIHWDNNQWIVDNKTNMIYSSSDAKKLCDLLNELSEKNKELKNKVEFFEALSQGVY